MSSVASSELSIERWGEYSNTEESDTDNLSPDLKKILIEGALNMETERADSSQDESISAYAIELPGEIGAMDETILHTILLHRYIRTMEDLLAEVSLLEDVDEEFTPEILSVPEKPQSVKRLPIVTLSERSSRSLLRKSCATLIGHIGFDTTKTSALDVLTDVADEFLRNLMGKLRIAMDQTAKSGPCGFPYPLVRTFTEMNVSVMALQDYYQVQVKKYHLTLLKRSKELHKQCAMLLKTKVKERVKEKVQELDGKGDIEEENIPELHVPALGEDQLQSSLEPGFQMLDSLEHDESFQNLENDEEIIVSDSPRQELFFVSPNFSSPTESQSKKRKLN